MKTTQHKKTDLLGNEYTEIRDESGKCVGRSEAKKDLFDKEYIQHFDADGKSIGQSELKTGFLGDEYIKHTDSNGHSAGTSVEGKTFLGDETKLTHKDAQRKQIGTSIEGDSFIHGKHTKHNGVNGIHARSDQLLHENDEYQETDPESQLNDDEDTTPKETSPFVSYLLGKLGIGFILGIVILIMTGEFINSMISGLILAFVGKFILNFLIKDFSKMGK